MSIINYPLTKVCYKRRRGEVMHGGDIYTEGLLKGRELIDFSSNINPLGVPISFKEHINEALMTLNRYPDIEYRELRNNLICYLGCSFINKDNIVLGNGAAEVIDLVISYFKSILIIVPSFTEYELNAQKWGCKIEYSFLDKDMKVDYEEILAKLRYCDAVIIGNPNNPNGSNIDKDKFSGILKYAEANNKTIILDEAFIEFTGEKDLSFINQLRDYKSIFIIRALTKFFAMPGIRLGYGISRNIELLNNIRKKQNPWNINCFAELAIKYVLKDHQYINQSLNWIRDEIVYLPEGLKNISFIETVYETKCNYVLCKLKLINDTKLYDLCLEKGIIIRKASNFRALDDSFVRFAIKDRVNNDLLLSVLESIEDCI